MIYNEIATVISNKQIAHNIYEAVLFSPRISKESKPGQFINILPSRSWNKVMRRPMSIASQQDNKISIIYKVFGEGTEIISKWSENLEVDIIGPLGNYWGNFSNKLPVLIGGGVGIAPIINLHKMLDDLNMKHILIMGAKKKEEHFMEHDPANHILLCTDKGKIGIKGNVISPLYEIIKENKNDSLKIFTCGPAPMIKAVAKFSLDNNIDCELALETIMACGFGICQGCTIIRKSSDSVNSYREKYALACVDGPVFNLKDLNYAYI